MSDFHLFRGSALKHPGPGRAPLHLPGHHAVCVPVPVSIGIELEPEAVVFIRGVGGGSGDSLQVSSGGSLRLAELFESAGDQVGADVVRSDEPIDISIIYTEGSAFESAQDAAEIRLSWEGWEEHARLPTDTMENITADNLQEAGRTMALALMIMGRERDY